MAPRILLFDVIRIISIAIMILSHITFLPWVLDLGWAGAYNVGAIAFLILLIVSGATLELSHHGNQNLKKRLLRLYPAYWCALALTFAVGPEYNLRDWVIQVFGANLYFDALRINCVGWIYGLFVILYIMYPYLSRLLRDYPYLGLAVLFIITLISKYFFYVYGNCGMWNAYYSFPLCNLMFFGAGIFISQKGIYLKYSSPKMIAFLAELSYFAFLLHLPFLRWWEPHTTYLTILFTASVALFELDRLIQKRVTRWT